MSDYNPQWQEMPGTTEGERTRGADKTALIALVISLTVLLACIPGLNCLIYVGPLIAGVIALLQAKEAANPDRARTYGWIATGIGVLILGAFLLIVMLYGAVIVSTLQEVQRLQ